MLNVYTGPTRAILSVPPGHEYAAMIREFTRSRLADWDFDPKLRRFVFMRSYVWYDETHDHLVIPIAYLEPLQEHLSQYGVQYSIKELVPITPRKIHLTMQPQWTDRPNQLAALAHITTSKEPRLGLQLGCGMGKTYIAVKTIATRGVVAMVVVSGLTDQWVEAVTSQTNIGNRIWVIKGFPTLKHLILGHHMPDVIICSLETLRAYSKGEGNYADIDLTYEQFLKKYGIGLKIYDEVHLNFHALTQMDLKADITTNLYLTATFTNSNKGTKRIFDTIYPLDMRFGADKISRHVDVIFYLFGGMVPENKCMSSRGYMHAKYEGHLLKKPTKFKDYMDRILLPRINSDYINQKKPGQKCLIFFFTIQMIREVGKLLRAKYPHLKVVEYVEGADDRLLETGEIILSTFKSAGTGTDIKKLKTVINTVSTKADTTIEQFLGRLRDLGSDDHPICVDLVDTSQSSHVRHFHVKKMIFHRLARTIASYNIP